MFLNIVHKQLKQHNCGAAFVLRSEDCLLFGLPCVATIQEKSTAHSLLAVMVKYRGVPDLIFTSRQVCGIIAAFLCLDIH